MTFICPLHPTVLGRVNMLGICQSGGVSGSFIVDPALAVTYPSGSSRLAEDRPNLSLESTESFVEADVWVVGAQGGSVSGAFARNLMNFKAHGLIYVRLVSPPLRSPHDAAESAIKHSLGTGPSIVNIQSVLGDVVVVVPRDFVGLVRTSSANHRAPVLPRRFSTLSDVHGEGVHFLGDWTRTGLDGWTGPALYISAPHGTITVKFLKPPEATAVTTAGSVIGFLLLLLLLPRPPACVRWFLMVVLAIGMIAYSFWLETQLL
ncbi:hypothetical protein AURDEDRAFT_172137 [Auricularia subglabra TFB-10046 SS5]|nr:hypothetical protein AURDEDRAFT_172137 [Auricularia subglabra TFB-10046 SS5]